MEDNTVMIEAVVKHEDAKEVFRAFCQDPDALSPQIAFRNEDPEHDYIVCGFRNNNFRQKVVGSIERRFPGLVDWR